MKLSEIKAGDRVKGFLHWGCVPAQATRAVMACDDGLFVKCREGRHLLDGQQDEAGELVGMCHA